MTFPAPTVACGRPLAALAARASPRRRRRAHCVFPRTTAPIRSTAASGGTSTQFSQTPLAASSACSSRCSAKGWNRASTCRRTKALPLGAAGRCSCAMRRFPTLGGNAITMPNGRRVDIRRWPACARRRSRRTSKAGGSRPRESASCRCAWKPTPNASPSISPWRAQRPSSRKETEGFQPKARTTPPTTIRFRAWPPPGDWRWTAKSTA